MRIVLDTNVLLVAISRKTIYYAIWKGFLEGRFEICVTSDILDEYAEILEKRLRACWGFFVGGKNEGFFCQFFRF